MPHFCVPWECYWAYTSGLWEQRWMGICDSTMGLSTTLFVMALLLSGAASMKSQAYFNKTGDLPCYFTNPQNISLDELVVFWQDQDKLVLYELLKGKENPQSVDANYKDRTSLDQDNWTLRLHNIQIKDKGLYQCFIYHRKSLHGMIIHQNDIDLSVLANFSQPEIMLISNRTENSFINVTCSSVQGYPKPTKMNFLLKTMNSTSEYDAVMKIIQDNITGLYNVSISSSLPVFPETNVSIFCVLQPEPTQTKLFSQPYNIDAKPPQPPLPVPDNVLLTALPVLLFGVSAMVVFFITLKKRKKKPGPAHECEVIRVEREESEQAKERVENRVPERSNEAQCIVNISKTDSGSVRKADKLKIWETKRDGDGSTLDPGAISIWAVANTKEDPCDQQAIDKP
ncbi:PREDICTED: T-lymphocyte activation antigen CD86 isoform X1 [Myotis davidii]|uniref:T-lymphocyte activation antigen CD86 isoform X1 n=2 Tax=Myotis davidii TaxID=225400 RepID=UPI000766E319|nr:PREDICTED: T-lymphocyte activation antigen CD86 isoform X1 [Myotis davidii]